MPDLIDTDLEELERTVIQARAAIAAGVPNPMDPREATGFGHTMTQEDYASMAASLRLHHLWEKHGESLLAAYKELREENSRLKAMMLNADEVAFLRSRVKELETGVK
jgi:predicted nuclease with TOPRIM domain